MTRRELMMIVIVGIGLGAVVALTAGGIVQLGVPQRTAATPVDADTLVSSLLEESATEVPAATATPSNAEVTPTAVPVEAGEAEGEDLADVLLLTDSDNPISDIFDFNFCRVATYYGLLCQQLDLAGETLQDEMLRDSEGNYFKLVGIDGERVIGATNLLNDEELEVLKTAVEEGGVTLVVSKVRGYGPGLGTLTDGAVENVFKPQDTEQGWTIGEDVAEVTRELTGRVFVPKVADEDKREPDDFALVLGEDESVVPLISGTDDAGNEYPIFVRQQMGAGFVFVDAGAAATTLNNSHLADMYYNRTRFTEILPLMMTMRFAMGDEVWHNSHDYANLTIDDADLVEPFYHLSFKALLNEMETYNYHTTIAMFPASWEKSEPTVVAEFLAHPDRYSLVQKGNNGDGYEFYKYSVTADDEYEARPIEEQEADIREGVGRMSQHANRTGIPNDRVMIFPVGISPEPTLVLLKRYNYLATVSGQTLPLDANYPIDWDFGMYQANMEFGNFPMLIRRHPGSYTPFTPDLDLFVMDLFIDKPALFYSHPYDGGLFDEGIGTFNGVAKEINDLAGEVEWQGLGYIIKHLYLEKDNDDGSVDVKMYTNYLIVTNESDDGKVYHIAKEETLNVPIVSLTVNGNDFPYEVEGTALTLDVFIPANSSAEVVIRYET